MKTQDAVCRSIETVPHEGVRFEIPAPVFRTAALSLLAGIVGAAGWSGVSAFAFLPLLYPFVYMHSLRRSDTISAVAYYAAATWCVVPACRQFFHLSSVSSFPLVVWLILIAVNSFPWVALFHSQYVSASAIASMLLLTVPPFGLFGVAHPLISVGAWFPGTRWIGLLFPLIMVSLHRKLHRMTTAVVLLTAIIMTHLLFQPAVRDSRVLALDTNLGGPEGGDPYGAVPESQEHNLQEIALSHPNSLILLPESVIPAWSRAHEQVWRGTFSQLAKQHTAILIGTTLPIPNTQGNQNVLLSRGYSEHLSYVQRVPAPLGMWDLGKVRAGFPLMLSYPPTIRVWNRRAGVLICYEQLLIWTALQSLARDPDLLFGPSNLYWAAGTRVPAIEHECLQNWANLWNIPYYEARNK